MSEAQLMKEILQRKENVTVAMGRAMPRDHYDATDRQHLEELADRMRRLTDARKMAGITLVHLYGLMLPRGFQFVLALLMLKPFGHRAVILFFQQLYKRDPQPALDMWAQTIGHMRTGKDREDAHSVGGWSQRELDIFTQHILPQLVR